MTISQALSMFELQERSLNALSRAWKAKLKQYHPDINPHGLEMSKLINAAYDFLKDKAEIWTQQNFQSDNLNYHLDEEIERIYEALKYYPGLTINLAGVWLWISGDTKPVKDTLKNLGCKWAAKKTSWYWRPEGAKKRWHSKPLDMEKIFATYGKEELKTESRMQI